MHHPTQYETMAKIKMSEDLRQSATWRLEQRARRMQRRGQTRIAITSVAARIVQITRDALRNLSKAVPQWRGRRTTEVRVLDPYSYE